MVTWKLGNHNELRTGKGDKVSEHKRDYKLVVQTRGLKVAKERAGEKAKARTNKQEHDHG